MVKTVWQKVFKQQDDIVSRDIVDETILVPIRGKLADMQRIFTIDSTAEYIWRQIDGKTTLERIYGKVLDTFDVDNEQAKEDILLFIHELESNTLISEVA